MRVGGGGWGGSWGKEPVGAGGAPESVGLRPGRRRAAGRARLGELCSETLHLGARGLELRVCGGDARERLHVLARGVAVLLLHLDVACRAGAGGVRVRRRCGEVEVCVRREGVWEVGGCVGGGRVCGRVCEVRRLSRAVDCTLLVPPFVQQHLLVVRLFGRRELLLVGVGEALVPVGRGGERRGEAGCGVRPSCPRRHAAGRVWKSLHLG